jgi:hypothetical protein
MKIYHSSLSKDAAVLYKALKPNEKLHALLSYGRRENHSAYFLVENRKILDGLVLDSGTFTKQKHPDLYEENITLEGYISYLENFNSQLDFYFNFDEDYDGSGFETNYINQLMIERQGFKPVPVVHDCYSDEIQRYIDAGHKLIAIGSGELKHAGLDELQMICEKPYHAGVKIHFLGITKFDKLANIPVYSCDASTWAHSSASGKVHFWNPEKRGQRKIETIRFTFKSEERFLKDYIDNHPSKWVIAKYLKTELGFTLNDLKGTTGYNNRVVANLHFFAQLEKIIDQKHKEQDFKFD